MDQILRFLSQPVLALKPEALQEMALRLATGKTFEPFALSPRTARSPERVMIIPVEGVLTNSEPFWGTPYSEIQSAVDHAASDPTVERVILAVDSPGGSLSGLVETASAIAELSKTKPVTST